MTASTPDDLAMWLERVELQLATLPDGLQAHVARARSVGAELAAVLHAPTARVDLAIAGHDLFRGLSDGEWLTESGQRGLPVDDVSADEPILLHGPLAAAWMADEGGVTDMEVLEAVRHHTTFAPGLGVLAATVFLADKTDPDKLRRNPWLHEVDQLARSGEWRTAMVTWLRTVARWLEKNGHTVHPLFTESISSLEPG